MLFISPGRQSPIPHLYLFSYSSLFKVKLNPHQEGRSHPEVFPRVLGQCRSLPNLSLALSLSLLLELSELSEFCSFNKCLFSLNDQI